MNIQPLLAYPRVLLSLNRFLRRPIDCEESKALIRRRMEAREARFLASVARHIYGYARSPYLPLLRHAGCEFGDLQGLVHRRGLEYTLQTLRAEGVYFSYEEFKGMKEVVRGGLTFVVSDSDFDNPFRGAGFEIMTGATHSRGFSVAVTIDFIAEAIAPALGVTLEAIRGPDPIVLWLAGFPSGAGVSHWLALGKMRRPPLRWYSMTDPRGPLVAFRHRRLWEAATMLARAWGIRLPLPEFIPVGEPGPVSETVQALRRAHGGCTVMTSPSAAVRLATLAQRMGESLEGVRILAMMEPLTPGKAAEIRRSGAVVFPIYGFSEGGVVGAPCGRPAHTDDMHFLADCYALILNQRFVEGIGNIDSYMFTSLLTSPRKIMLNVEIDDFGAYERRRCGCVYDDLGLHDHFAHVRSFTKLTGEGTMVLGRECVPILEEILPREFGGRSIDYQVLEAEDERHLTRLFLVISPTVGPIDERRALARFIEELRRAQPRGIRLWLQADSVRVLRREPVLTPRGKLLPVHTQATLDFEEGAMIR